MEESCGKCAPCRVGTVQIHRLLGTRNTGPPRPTWNPWKHSATSSGMSLRPGPIRLNPVRSALRFFRQEFLDRMVQPADTREHTMSLTLTIDNRPVSGRAGETIPQVAADHGIRIPTLCHLEGLSGPRFLPVVPGGGRRRQTAARLRHPDPGRHGGAHPLGAARPSPPPDHRTAAGRTQPRVRGLYGQRQLRTAGPGNGIRGRPSRLSAPVPVAAGGWFACAFRPRPQPLHPLHLLRAGLRRDRGGAHLGRQPRQPQPDRR